MENDPLNADLSESEDEEELAPEVLARQELETAMTWIGIEPGQQTSALADELGSMKYLPSFTATDITNMTKTGVTYGNNRKMKFTLGQKKHLQALLAWAKDRKKLNEPISLASSGITTVDEFISAIELAQSREDIRGIEDKTLEAQIKIASPGKLKDEKIWEDWMTGLQTTLTLMRGVTGVPLVYVIRPDETAPEGEVYASFDEECIAKAPLSGPAFDADARSVYLIIQPLVLGENAAQWIHPTTKTHKKNGRVDFLKLQAHYQGEGNSSRRIHEAETLWKNLHYKNERALPFATFISKAQFMLNIYTRNDEHVKMSAQVRWLLDKVQDPVLTATIASLKLDVDKDPHHLIWDFTKCANHIQSQIRKPSSTEHSKNISSVNAKTSSGRNGIYKDGEVFTGTYKYDEWKALSNDDRSTVIKARNNNKGGGNGGGGAGGGPKNKNKKVKALTKKVKRQQKQIASLKKRKASSSDDSDEESEQDEPMNDAGNSFGGRAGKKNSKKKKSE